MVKDSFLESAIFGLANISTNYPLKVLVLHSPSQFIHHYTQMLIQETAILQVVPQYNVLARIEYHFDILCVSSARDVVVNNLFL